MRRLHGGAPGQPGPALHALELKIPPPLVALACGLGAWFAARATPALTFACGACAMLAVLLALAGIVLGAWGVLVFRGAGTSVDPHRPDKARVLVTSGPWRYTRNPMYLGLALVLAGGCLWLAHPAGIAAVAAFIGWLTRFQIMPEERVLAAKFGAAWTVYRRRVRRWI